MQRSVAPLLRVELRPVPSTDSSCKLVPVSHQTADSTVRPATPPWSLRAMEAGNFELLGKTGELVIKQPGSINGCAHSVLRTGFELNAFPPCTQNRCVADTGSPAASHLADTRCVPSRADVVLKDLQDCEVYVLDYSGEVEVSNCTSCKLFFGARLAAAVASNAAEQH